MTWRSIQKHLKTTILINNFKNAHGESGQLFRSLERLSFPVLGKQQFTVKLKISIRTKVSVATRQDSIIRDFLFA